MTTHKMHFYCSEYLNGSAIWHRYRSMSRIDSVLMGIYRSLRDWVRPRMRYTRLALGAVYYRRWMMFTFYRLMEGSNSVYNRGHVNRVDCDCNIFLVTFVFVTILGRA